MNTTKTPIPWRDVQIIQEVIGQYNLTDTQARAVFEAIEQEWRDTSGRFYAYTTAHRVCAAMFGS